jgi:aminoglycoside phosphotransferase (APT) family kinase protein
MTEPGDATEQTSAPKFHKDRSAYGPALQGWLQRVIPGASDVEITQLDIPVATGFSNETVIMTAAWTINGARVAERLVGRIEPADGALFPTLTPATAVSVGLQHRIMEVVASAGVAPVPATIGYEVDPAVLGQPFFVMRFVDGRVPGDQPRYSQAGFLVDEATPEERRRMVLTGLEALAGIHSIDWRAAGLEWLDPTGGRPTTAAHVAVYRRFAADELAGRDHPVLVGALDWLEMNDPLDDRIGLSWGDARLGNIIWDDYRPAAVVDWEAAAICPTEADVGWWLMFDRMSFDDMGVDRLAGFPTREEMIAHYAAVSGREVRNPHYWEVFAVMRFCAIFIRLADRMSAAGLLPEALNYAVANQVSDALARLIEIDNPYPPAF